MNETVAKATDPSPPQGSAALAAAEHREIIPQDTAFNSPKDDQAALVARLRTLTGPNLKVNE